MQWLPRGLLVVCLAVAPASACSTDGKDRAVRLPPNAAVDVVVKVTRTEVFGGKRSNSAPRYFRYRQDLKPTAEGYRVTQTLVGMEPSSGWSGMDASRVNAKLVYDADTNLKPVRVANWQATIEAGLRRAREVAALSPELSATYQRDIEELGRYSDEEAVALVLRDQLAASTGVAGPTGECTRTLDGATGLATRTVCVTTHDIPGGDGNRRTERIVITQRLARL